MRATIRAIPTAAEGQRKECIAAAEDLLAKAKAGEVLSFVAICDCPANEWLYIQSYCPDRFELLGKVQAAAYRLAAKLFDG